MTMMGMTLTVERVADGIAARIKALSDPRKLAWYAFASAFNMHEEMMKNTIASLFEWQKQEVVGRIDVIKSKELDSWMFEPRTWEYRFGEGTSELFRTIVMVGGSRSMGNLPVQNVSFDINEERVQGFVNEQPYRMGRVVNETTARELRAILVDGVQAGETGPQLKKRVETYYDGIKGSRAKMIARTETNGAANFGTLEGYKQSGVVQGKEWLATLDGRVRDLHAIMDGEIVGVDERFSNGLMYPGDPVGGPEQTANCRCTTIAVLEKQ